MYQSVTVWDFSLSVDSIERSSNAELSGKVYLYMLLFPEDWNFHKAWKKVLGLCSVVNVNIYILEMFTKITHFLKNVTCNNLVIERRMPELGKCRNLHLLS